MKLVNTDSPRDRAIASLAGVELNEQELRLNVHEREILRQAQVICDQAQRLLEQYYNDEDVITPYGEVDHCITEILE